MSHLRDEITPARAALMKQAVYIVGGQDKVGLILHVTQATISRWCRELGPIPQPVVLWAKQTITDNERLIQEA